MFDLFVPTPEFVDFVGKDAGGGSLIERALPDVVDVPAQDIPEGRRFFTKHLEVEANEQDVRCRQAGVKEILDELVEARCLSHLPRAADHFDKALNRPQPVDHLPDQGATVTRRGGAHRLWRLPPRIEIAQDGDSFGRQAHSAPPAQIIIAIIICAAGPVAPG